MNTQLLMGNLKLVRLLLHAAGAVVLASALAGFFEFWYSPLSRQRNDHAQRIDHVAMLLEAAPEVRRSHAELAKSLQELQQQVSAVRRRIPVAASEDEFLSTVKAIAREEGLTLDECRRGAIRTAATHSELELTLACKASYSSLCRFLTRIEQLPRLTRLDRLAIWTQDTSGEYPAEVILMLYFGYDTDSEAHI